MPKKQKEFGNIMSDSDRFFPYLSLWTDRETETHTVCPSGHLVSPYICPSTRSYVQKEKKPKQEEFAILQSDRPTGGLSLSVCMSV
jgi:hypothetical protein